MLFPSPSSSHILNSLPIQPYILFLPLFKKSKQKRNIIPTPTKKNSNEIQTDKRTVSQKLSPPGHGACPGVLMYPVSLIGEN